MPDHSWHNGDLPWVPSEVLGCLSKEVWPLKDEPSHSSDDRAPFAKAFGIASQIIAAGAGVGLLALAGHWLDKRLGWNGPFLIVGVLLGGTTFFWQMLKLVKHVSPTE